MNSKNNNIVTVIQSVAKNLGNTHLMYPRSFTPFRMTKSVSIAVLSTLCSVLFISSCQHEEMPPVAKDALALLPAETPVGIQAQLQGGFAQGESRTETSTTTTNWYALNEIHPTKEYVAFDLSIPGAADPNKTILGASNLISFGNLSTTEPFSSLKLKDFNLTEGGDRCVSRWTAIAACCNGWDYLYGFARLQADAQGNPVLNFGELQHADVKVTLVLQDEKGNPILVNNNQVSASLSLPESFFNHIYTPEGKTQAIGFSDYLKNIKTLQADEDIDPARFGFAVYDIGQVYSFSLSAMRNADGTASYYGEKNNMLTNLVRPTPTHTTTDETNFTPIEGGPQLTDAEVLTIEVNEDPDAYGLLTTGKYTLKLKDVMVTENGQQKPLTALESGKHYTLTVTLQHNMKMQATATIGGWDEVSADVDLNQDPSFIPPYEYKEADDTYYIYLEEGLELVLTDRMANNHTDASIVYEGVTYEAVVSGTETDLAAAIGDKTTIIFTGTETAAIRDFIQNKTGAAFTLLLPNITTIGEQAFYSCFSLASISLPSATAVGKQAFYGCNNLVSVSLPSATTVGEVAFFGCTSLASISLPSATAIGKQAFFGCVSFTTLSFGSVITELGYEAFYNVGNGGGNCALTLANGQKHIEISPTGGPSELGNIVNPADENADVYDRIWADYTWKSITIK